jgi:hypothetical protein
MAALALTQLPLPVAQLLAAAFDPGALAAMQHDAEQLAAQPAETAESWQRLADALGEACVLAEHAEQPDGGRSAAEPPDRARIEFVYCGRTYGAWRADDGSRPASWRVHGRSGTYTWRQLLAHFQGAPAGAVRLVALPERDER